MEETNYVVVTNGPYVGIVRRSQPIGFIPKCALNPDGSLNRDFRFSDDSKIVVEEEEMPDLVPVITGEDNKLNPSLYADF